MSGAREHSNGIDPFRDEAAGGTGPRGIVDPNTGLPVGANDPFFREINAELADRGFLVTTADNLITWARTGSLMWMTFGLAWLRRGDDAGLHAAL